MENFEDLCQECSTDDFGLTFSFSHGTVKFAFWAFNWVEFMNFAEDFRAKVNKYS